MTPFVLFLTRGSSYPIDGGGNQLQQVGEVRMGRQAMPGQGPVFAGDPRRTHLDEPWITGVATEKTTEAPLIVNG